MVDSKGTGLRKQIQQVLAVDYRGPKAGYTEVDVLKALFAIGRSETNLGRLKLGQLVGLGQGEVRTLIARLRDSGLISVDSRGASLTEKGRREFAAISKTIPCSSPVQARELAIGRTSWFVVVRGRETKVLRGLEQRDAAVRAGATGALTVLYKAGRFTIPRPGNEDDPASDCEAMGPAEPWTRIREVAEPRDGDVVIVSGAETPILAEAGALASALTLL